MHPTAPAAAAIWDWSPARSAARAETPAAAASAPQRTISCARFGRIAAPPEAGPASRRAARGRPIARRARRAGGTAPAAPRAGAPRADGRAGRSRRPPPASGRRRDVDHRQVEPARPERRQRSERAVVGEGRQRKDEGARWECARRDHLDVAPRVARDHLGVDQRVEHAVGLRAPGRRKHPAQDASEADDADPVAAAQVGGRQRRRRPDGQVDRNRRLCERVEEEDDVGVPLGVVDVRVEGAAPGAHPPVDAPQPVAGLVPPHVGELEALSRRAARVRPDRGLRADGPRRLPDRLDLRMHPDLERCLDGRVPDAQAERLANPDVGRDDESSPPIARQVERHHRSYREPVAGRGAAGRRPMRGRPARPARRRPATEPGASRSRPAP